MRKAAHQPEVSWQGPAQGHGLCDPAVTSLPPGERMQQTVPDAIKLSSGSANIPDDSRSIRKLYYYNVPPQAALRPGRDGTGHNSFCGPVLQGSSFSQGALYFGLMIWVNGSVLLTDGSLLGVPAKAGF